MRSIEAPAIGNNIATPCDGRISRIRSEIQTSFNHAGED